MTLSEALKIPGIWWVVHRNHPYAQDGRPAKVEVVEVVKTMSNHSLVKIDEVVEVVKTMSNHSLVKIDNGALSRIQHTFHEWDAYANFWLAWAAIQRSRK